MREFSTKESENPTRRVNNFLNGCENSMRGMSEKRREKKFELNLQHNHQRGGEKGKDVSRDGMRENEKSFYAEFISLQTFFPIWM